MNSSAGALPQAFPLSAAAGWLAVAVAASLPWSTSATGILVAVWLLTLVPTLNVEALRRELLRPAAGLTVLLVLLALLGLSWTEADWRGAFGGLTPYLKLLAIPLLFLQFRQSDRGWMVLGAFLVSCTLLLALSLLMAAWPTLLTGKGFGVPVKDHIAQSGEFVLCAFGLLCVALDLKREGRLLAATACVALAAAFLFDVFYVATSRTTLVTIPFLLAFLAFRELRWKAVLGLAIVAALLGSAVWFSSPYLRLRVENLRDEILAYRTDRSLTSAGERLDFWTKSVSIIAEAPLLGHGTGSMKTMFEKAGANETGVWAQATANPHNQTFAIGIQLGLAGVALLLAMWISHLLLFHGPGLATALGAVVVLQNIVSSLFNSHLFDFTQGWSYVFGVGVVGGMVLRGGSFPKPSPDGASPKTPV